jgi:hypothetical protein
MNNYLVKMFYFLFKKYNENFKTQFNNFTTKSITIYYKLKL